MQKLFRCRKLMGLSVLISTCLLYFPVSPSRAAMITTEYVIHHESSKHSDRAQIKAFLGKADVIAQMQANGISHKEALARVDSLTDSEIDALAGQMDQIPAGAGGNGSGGMLSLLGLALYAIIAAIVLYFAFRGDKEEKPHKASEANYKVINGLESRHEADNF